MKKIKIVLLFTVAIFFTQNSKCTFTDLVINYVGLEDGIVSHKEDTYYANSPHLIWHVMVYCETNEVCVVPPFDMGATASAILMEGGTSFEYLWAETDYHDGNDADSWTKPQGHPGSDEVYYEIRAIVAGIPIMCDDNTYAKAYITIMQF